MERTDHEETIAYLLDISGIARAPQTRKILGEAVAQLQVLLSPDIPSDRGAAFSYKIGLALLELPLGKPDHNKELAIGYFEGALAGFDRKTFPGEWAAVMYALGNAWTGRILGNPAENVERAIECHNQALEMRDRNTDPEKWAASMYALGNAHLSRIRGIPEENQEKAVGFFKKALTFWKKETHRSHWLSAMYSLGNAYRERICENPSKNQERAIAVYKKALSAVDGSAERGLRAMIMYSLGTLYTTRIRGNSSINIEKAIAFHLEALSVWNKKDDPMDWAMVQYAMGNTYFGRIRGSRAKNIEDAIEYYNQALTIWQQKSVPERRAMANYSLGNACSVRIRGNPAENVEQSIRCYEQALLVWLREEAPRDWAMAMYGLGIAYRRRIRGNLSENREKAIDFFQQALSIRKRESLPLDWARTMYALGVTYNDRILGDASENQEEAIRYYKEALLERKWDVVPHEWALTMYALGNAYSDRILGLPADNQDEAIGCYADALSFWTKANAPLDWGMALCALGNIYCYRIRGNEAENIETAITCYTAALTTRKKNTVPVEWAATMYALGNAYFNRISGNRPENRERAILCYRKTLAVRTKDTLPMDWAMTMYALGYAYSDRPTGDSLSNCKESIRYYEAALSVLTAEANPRLFYHSLFGLALTLFKQARIPGHGYLMEKAVSLFREALERISEIFTEIAHPRARKDYLRQNQFRFHGAIQALLQQGFHAEAFYWLERIRSHTLLEDINPEHLMLAKAEAADTVRDHRRLSREIHTLRSLLAMDTEKGMERIYALDSRHVSSSHSGRLSQEQMAEAQSKLKDCLNHQRELVRKLAIIDPDYAAFLRPVPLTENDLRGLLEKTRSAAVQCFVDIDFTCVRFLVAIAEEFGLQYKLLQFDDIKPFMDVFDRFHIAYNSGSRTDMELINDLLSHAGKIMQPVADLLHKHGIRRIFLSPHSFLQAVPLHAALLPRTHTYFLEDFEACYTPSFTLSCRLSRSQVLPGRKVLALFYSEKGSKQRPYLEHGELEFSALPDIYGHDAVILASGSTATLHHLAGLLEKEGGNIRLLQLICHGENSPAGIFLHLNGGPVSHVELLEALNLGEVPLVVLGVCETGKSNEWTQRYEEYKALDSLFLQLGARGVISSFYRVEEAATLAIMRQFHKRVEKGQCPFHALRSAQKSILRNASSSPKDLKKPGGREKERRAGFSELPATHPYYWAFIKYSGTFG